MAVTTDYATATELKTWLAITGTAQDSNLAAAISAASRSIDTFCGRRFWLEEVAEARQFTPEFGDVIWLDDIGSASGLVVETDSNDDGTYDTVWTAGARTGYGYVTEPLNALTATQAAAQRPVTALRALASLFPVRRASTQVTALWGFPAVPDPIQTATVLWASRLWKRKDAVLGVAGGPDVGFVELAKRLDPDIERAIRPYRRMDIGAV